MESHEERSLELISHDCSVEVHSRNEATVKYRAAQGPGHSRTCSTGQVLKNSA
jgi:hypothetical protein